jgi:hypothetical protein
MKHPRHSWIEQGGFRVDKCEHCGCTRKWDDGFKRMVYYKENGAGPFFWAPICKFVMITDIPIKM